MYSLLAMIHIASKGKEEDWVMQNIIKENCGREA